ncbi:MAG: hypothetical protein DIZ80_08925 [endosymbiont of Galathealinum brachiosum]|uniref:Low-complexity protein n=1 Tax=endosymbiont of Galathealinum brachiosum TaxID=2200906 RepID=A0A370DBX5_9GAMM|nr:MAG: hypothetical protein DIZ80_08925 [endosymbiont of Galathealinum brachiosum]
MKKIISIALAALFAASLSMSVQAAENPFGMSDIDQSSKVSMSSSKCGEGKCGGGDKKKDGKCGEGKCGGDKKKEGKCGEGKCGGS